MYLCLRVDLDYVPWDTPDAREFGHGEPAAFLRLLDLAKYSGHKLHFFASNRVLRAFSSLGDAILGDGHDLDWLCKHPDSADRATQAIDLFGLMGHHPLGLATRNPWPDNALNQSWLRPFKFLSSPPGPAPAGLTHFPVETRGLRDATQSGQSARAWADGIKLQLRDAATRDRGLTVCVRPQVLAKVDPRLTHIKEILDLAEALDIPVATLRDLLKQNI
jgi:hypothetical protein